MQALCPPQVRTPTGPTRPVIRPQRATSPGWSRRAHGVVPVAVRSPDELARNRPEQRTDCITIWLNRDNPEVITQMSVAARRHRFVPCVEDVTRVRAACWQPTGAIRRSCGVPYRTVTSGRSLECRHLSTQVSHTRAILGETDPRVTIRHRRERAPCERRNRGFRTDSNGDVMKKGGLSAKRRSLF